jgi:hypothetical protein
MSLRRPHPGPPHMFRSPREKEGSSKNIETTKSFGSYFRTFYNLFHLQKHDFYQIRLQIYHFARKAQNICPIIFIVGRKKYHHRHPYAPKLQYN